MNFRILTGLAAIVCISLASCHPYNENQNKKKPTQGTEKKVTPEEQAKLKEQEAKKKAEDEMKKKAEEGTQTLPTENPGGATTPPTEGPKPPVPAKRSEYPVASSVPGKEGFVFSPYNNKIICVRDEQDRLIPSGTLVQDPTFPASEKKYFRVP